MNKLKVVHIVEALGGGVYTYFINLTNALCSLDDVDLTVIYSDKRQEIDPNKIAEDFHQDTTLIKIPMCREISLSQDFAAYKHLKKELKKLNPDVLHLHSSKAGILGRLAFLSNFGLKAKLFYTPHGYAFLRKDVSKLKQLFFLGLEFFSTKLTGGLIIACGDTELKYAKKIGRARLVRNGVDHRELMVSPKSSTIQRVGILARITAQRNPQLFNTIALAHPEIDFVWIGDGELRQTITASNITVTGWFKNKEEGLSHLAQLDVYLHTSLWEGLPIAILEAMSREIPVLATNVIGNKDAVATGRTGYLFSDLEGFNSNLDKIKPKQVREELGVAAGNRSRLLFDSTKNAERLLAIYREE